MTIGDTVSEQANSRGNRVFIGAAGTNEYKAVQDKRLVVNYDVIAEPITNGNTAFFSGVFLGGLFTGTMLYTSDIADGAGTEGTFLNLIAKDSVDGGNDELTWNLKITNKASATKTWTFTGILQTFELSGDIPGASKYDLAIFVTSEPTIS
jgi:hypothetical protein